jgi:RND family efflux transporter MFP subunit
MNPTNTTEEQLRAEIEGLKHQLEQERRAAAEGHAPRTMGPSKVTLLVLGLVVIVLIVAGFFKGYLPHQQREEVLAAEARTTGESLPVVNVELVKRADSTSGLILPGNIQAVTEAPILARAGGYIKARRVDIGDRVQAGQVLAEIEAPELDQQIRQAQSSLEQANSVVQQAEAALQQGRANANMARVTAQRWANLVAKGAVSKQENDTYQAQNESQQANVQALERALAAAKSNVGAVAANLARFGDLKNYQTVRAPFAGVITVRNVDVGALVNDSNTLLFRIAQMDRLRVFINVPQADASAVRVGQTATLRIPDLPGRTFSGKVSRAANVLDPSTRTLLVEVQVSNAAGTLMPGMYTLVDFALPRRDPPLLIPGDTLVVRADGPQVAVVRDNSAVHYAHIQLGRDFGDRLEVFSGLEAGQRLVVSPSDSIREGVHVRIAAEPAAKGKQ